MADKYETPVQDGSNVGQWATIAGMQAVSIQVKFKYGSAGEDVSVILQTSLDEESSAIDIAHFQFGQKDGRQIANITGRAPLKPCDADAPLAPGEIRDGFLGDKLRWVIDAKGGYENSTVWVSVAPR